jgi:hypothetical protein
MKKDSLRNHSGPTSESEVEEANRHLRAKRLSEKRRPRKIRSGDESGYGNVRDTDIPGDVQNGETQPQAGARMTSRNDSPAKN